MALCAAGCSSTAPDGSTGGGLRAALFGGSAGKAAAQNVSVQAAQHAPAGPSSLRCPKVEIRSGTETITVGERGAESDPASVRYQATLGDFARECTRSDTIGTIRLGVSGRVILGPKGAPGTFSVPVRIAVVRGTDAPVYSELLPVSVTVPPGQTSALFTHVAENVAFPLEPSEKLSQYMIYVGFDEGSKMRR